MNLHIEFEKFCKENLGIQRPLKILIAVSGGVDSMVLLHLLSQTGHDIAAAHCNFGLRGKESDEDEQFLTSYCRKNKIRLFCKKVSVKSYQTKHKQSIQEAARDIRYTWFKQLSLKYGIDLIATAHHLNDNVETLLLNITRGTGINGLKGIPVKNQNIIRPLTFASREEIETYAKVNEVPFRTDSSNLKNTYSRNKIRNLVIPVLKEINPALELHVKSLTRQVEFAESIFRKQVLTTWDKVHSIKGEQIEISIRKLVALDHSSSYLFEFLHPFGFNASQVVDIHASLNSQSGKRFISSTHELIKDRTKLLIRKASKRKKLRFSIDFSESEILTDSGNITFKFYDRKKTIQFTPNTFLLDAAKLTYPLKLRKWKNGDRFVPLGMNSEMKISDFFINIKLSIAEKQDAWVLCSGKHIVCILPYRISENFKITDSTKRYLKVSFPS